MKINSNVTKVLAATVAASAVTLSAVGLGGTASADGSVYYPGVQPAPIVNGVPYQPFANVRYNTPVLINGRWVYPYQGYVAPNYAVPNYVAPVYPYAYQVQYVQAAVTASQFNFITSASSVLGMNRGDVVLKLQQGKTLTAIAAERNVSRATLYNAVINTMRGSINIAVSSGAISPMTGNAMQQNLNNRAGVVIDQAGTVNGTNAAAIETAFQLL